MSRVQLVQKPEDFPPTEGFTDGDVSALFDHFGVLSGKREIGDTAKVFAVMARDPKLALLLIKVSDYMTQKLPWPTKRNDLRQLMIQVINSHFKSDYNFQAHISSADRVGISPAMQAVLPLWDVTNVFDDEQKLVIEYTLAAIRGDASDDLFQRVVAQFGELGAIEFTTGVAWWSFWSIICSAVRPENDYGYSSAARAA